MLYRKICVRRRTLDDRFGEDLGYGFGSGARSGCIRTWKVRIVRFAYGLGRWWKRDRGVDRRGGREGGGNRYRGLIANRYGLYGSLDGGGAGSLRRYGTGNGVGGSGRCGQYTRWRYGTCDGARGDRRLHDERRSDGPCNGSCIGRFLHHEGWSDRSGLGVCGGQGDQLCECWSHSPINGHRVQIAKSSGSWRYGTVHRYGSRVEHVGGSGRYRSVDCRGQFVEDVGASRGYSSVDRNGW